MDNYYEKLLQIISDFEKEIELHSESNNKDPFSLSLLATLIIYRDMIFTQDLDYMRDVTTSLREHLRKRIERAEDSTQLLQ